MTEEDQLCPICTEPIHLIAFGSCNHPICHLCCLRLRALYKTNNCPLCKTDLKQVIVLRPKDPLPLFETLDLTNLPTDKLLSLSCDQEILDELLTLLRFNCPDTSCDAVMNSWKQLLSHVKDKHGKQICNICLKHKKIFAHEHKLFTRKSLEKHIKEGDDKTFKGHPECKFCCVNFYSDDELFGHCREKHEECHLCSRNGKVNLYFRDYKDLEGHFREDHFYCEESGCKEKTFVVFDSMIDFKAHMVSEHGGKMSKYEMKQSKKVNLSEFHQSSSSLNNEREKREPKIKAPPGFGGSITYDRQNAKITEQQDQSSESVQETPSITDFPSMSSSAQLNPTSIFLREMLDRKTLSLLSSLPLSHEAKVAQNLCSLVNDSKKFKAICAHSTNYLLGSIVPERLNDHMEKLVGVGYRSIFDEFVLCFPDSLRKKLKECGSKDEFPELRSVGSDLESEFGVEKHLNKGKFSSSGEKWDRVSGIVSGLSDADFPALPSSSSNSSSLKENKKKQVLFSNSLQSNVKPTSSITSLNNTTNSKPGTKKVEQQIPSSNNQNSFNNSSTSIASTNYSSSLTAKPKLNQKDFPSLPKSEGKPIVWKPILTKVEKQDGWVNLDNLDKEDTNTSNSSSTKKNKKKVLLKFG